MASSTLNLMTIMQIPFLGKEICDFLSHRDQCTMTRAVMDAWGRGGQFANDLLEWAVAKSDRMLKEGLLDAKMASRLAREDKLRQHAHTLLSLIGESLYYTSTTHPTPGAWGCMGHEDGVHLKWLQHMHRISAFNHRALALSRSLLLFPDTITNPVLAAITSERVWAYVGPLRAHPPMHVINTWMNVQCVCSGLPTQRGIQAGILLSNLQLEVTAGLWDVQDDAVVADYFDYTLFVSGPYTLDIETQMGTVANSFDLEKTRYHLQHFE
jgi:hypothetical protein